MGEGRVGGKADSVIDVTHVLCRKPETNLLQQNVSLQSHHDMTLKTLKLNEIQLFFDSLTNNMVFPDPMARIQTHYDRWTVVLAHP